ncbi:MAG: hypothetical protein IKN65_02190 [Clostridia bacterium]|nr:hypothetical protein [Clostridia bacterium]
MSEQKVKTTSKKNVKLIVLIALLIALIVLIPIGYALFSDRDKESTQTEIGRIEVELKEDWPEPGETDPLTGDQYDEFGLKKNAKKIWGHSVGNLPAYVRIRCIPIVEYNTDKENGQGEWVTAPVPQENIIVTIDSKNDNQEDTWISSGNYWYYNRILPAGEDTSKMSISWQIDELPSELEGYKVRADVRVILEYAQTTNDKWKEIFQIDDLPDGVQK